MHFQVPQFIETEDKIIGPLTLKQFLYVAACGFGSFLLYFVLEVWLWLIVALVIMSIGISFAFLKVNGRNMAFFARSAMSYVWNPKTYVFRARTISAPAHEMAEAKYVKAPAKAVPAPIQSRIKNISEQLATSKTAIPKREQALPPSLASAPKEVKERYEMVRRITGDSEMARK